MPMKTLHRSLLLALLVVAAPSVASAQGLPTDVLADLRQTAETARRAQAEDDATYRRLGNPYLLETRRRQGAQRAEADMLASVNRNGLRYPNFAAAIADEASRLMPEHAASIRSNVQASFPGTTGRVAQGTLTTAGPSRPGTPANVQVPTRWYSSGPQPAPQPSAQPSTLAAAYSGYPQVNTAPAMQGGNWYSQPILQRYGGSAASATPQAPNYAPAYGQFGQQQVAMASGEQAVASAALTEVWDPIEPFNRIFHSFNEVFDTFLLRPLAWSFGQLPGGMKDAVGRAVENTRHPVILANNLLQGQFSQAGKTMTRFLVNSTLGIGGLIDPAGLYLSMPYQDADFGQTLYSYGLGPGPYLELPLLGPSNTRDTVGRVADAAMSPWGYILGRGEALVMTAPKPIVVRERYMTMIDELRESSVDFYVSLRDSSQQIRAGELLKRAGEKPGESGKSLDDMFNQSR